MPDIAPAAHAFGYRATIAALAVGQIVCWAAMYYAFTAFVLPMQREMGWTAASMMGAYTAGLMLSAAASFAVGAAIDRGRGREVMTLGPLLGGAGFALWSIAAAPSTLYAAWLVIGAGIAMTLYEPAFTIVTRRWPDRFREGVTTLTLVGGLASTLAFPSVAALQTALGWRGALIAIALVLLAMAALHWVVLAGPSIARSQQPAAAPVEPDATLHQAVGSRSFWALTLTFTTYSFAAGALWGHMAPALADQGLDETRALAVLVWFGPAQVAGRLAFALLGKRFGLRALGLVVLAGLPLACLLFAYAGSVAALIAFAVLFGLANGVATLVRGGLLPDYFGRTALGRIGGLMSGVAQFARAAAPLAAAWMLSGLAGYRQLMLVVAAIGTVGWCAFALAGRPARPR